MKKYLLSAIMLLALNLNASAQVTEPKNTPQLAFAMQLKVTLGEAYSCGEMQHGTRTVIPITGGTFEGPDIKGTSGKDANGNPSFYFKCAPLFEAPADSKYAWLNNALFLCAPDFSPGFKGIVLNVWKVL